MLESQWWRVDLPDDWEEESGGAEGTLYFRSADKSKGFYICTLLFGDDKRTAEEILGSIQTIELNSNDSMEGANWQVIRKHRDLNPDGVYRWRLDMYDARNCYRIQSQLLAKFPTVVRSTFHDYYVEDFNESSRFFEPIISSLELK